MAELDGRQMFQGFIDAGKNIETFGSKRLNWPKPVSAASALIGGDLMRVLDIMDGVSEKADGDLKRLIAIGHTHIESAYLFYMKALYMDEFKESE